MAAAGEAGGEAAALRGLLELLEEQRREAELLLERHHGTLRCAVERALASSQDGHASASAGPCSEALPALTEEGCLVNGAPDLLSPRAFLTEGSSVVTACQEVVSEQTPSPGPTRVHSAFMRTLMKSEDGSMVTCEVASGSLLQVLSRIPRELYAEMFVGFLVFANTVVMFMQLELEGRAADARLATGHGEISQSAKTVFEIFAHFFTAMFLIELVAKLLVHRHRYFLTVFNLFDFGIVLITVVDLYVLSHIGQQTENVSFLRITRMLRLARVLRVIRTVEFFQQLRVLTRTIILSFVSIFWSMLILFIFMLIGALLLCQMLQNAITDDAVDPDMRVWVSRYYGTSSKALYTMFEATFSGCWPTYARPLIEQLSIWYALFFVLYVTFVVFTLIRIIYGLLLKDTMQAATSDADQMVRARTLDKKKLVRKLSDLFTEANKTGDGYLTFEEFKSILAYPRVKTWLGTIGVEVENEQQLFEIMHDSHGPEGRVSRAEFIHGMMRMQGQAREEDLLSMVQDTHRILLHCQALRLEVEGLRERGTVNAGADGRGSGPSYKTGARRGVGTETPRAGGLLPAYSSLSCEL